MSFKIEVNEKELLELYALLRDRTEDDSLQAVLKKIENAVYEVASIDEIEEISDARRI